MLRSMIRGRTAIVLGWVGFMILAVAITAGIERQRLLSELQREAAILHRLASQRADQHDAHLTSLSALAMAADVGRKDLFLDVASMIQSFYPRIVAVDLVPLEQPGHSVTTRPDLSNDVANTIMTAASSSEKTPVLRRSPEASGRYLVIKRSSNRNAARFGLALTVDAEKLLASNDDFWRRPCVARSLSLPDGTVLFSAGMGSTVMQFSRPLGSGSQSLVFKAGISPEWTDLLPANRVLLVAAAMTALYMLAVLGLMQFARARRAELQARLSADEARFAHASRVNALGEMASGMVHELTQPLTAILSQAQAGRHLVCRGDSSGLEISLARIVEQAKRAGAILNWLRDWTRPQSHRIEDTLVNEAIGNVEALLCREAQKEKVNLSTDLSATHNVLLHLDQVALEQIVFNLVRNAVEAASGSINRWVTVTSGLTQTGFIVEVSDSGPGVPEDVRNRLFEPFVTGKPEGTGLGLALCQRLAERMGGELALVEGRADTVFRLCLPASVVDSREAA